MDMTKIDDKIAQAEKKMKQSRARLRDLKAQANRQDRKDDARKKILYGAAYLAGLATLTERAQEQSLARVHAQIHSKRDREFLGLPPLDGDDGDATGVDRDVEQDLPFGLSTQ